LGRKYGTAGLPDVLVLVVRGRYLNRVTSTHCSGRRRKARRFDPTPVVLPLMAGETAAVPWTDGVIESRNHLGEQYGRATRMALVESFGRPA